MNVVVDVVWHIVVDHMIHSFDVETTFGDGCGNQDWLGSGSEMSQSF